MIPDFRFYMLQKKKKNLLVNKLLWMSFRKHEVILPKKKKNQGEPLRHIARAEFKSNKN